MNDFDISRRKYLQMTGVGAAFGLAGCVGSEDENGDDSLENVVPQRVHDYMSDAINYENVLTDRTEGSIVTVAVGQGDDGRGFQPAAIRVTKGTKIIWEWTGNGLRMHNVTFVETPDEGPEPSELSSGETVNEEETRHELTLEKTGIYLYESSPHSSNGMKGAVFVVEEESGSESEDENSTNTTDDSNASSPINRPPR